MTVKHQNLGQCRKNLVYKSPSPLGHKQLFKEITSAATDLPRYNVPRPEVQLTVPKASPKLPFSRLKQPPMQGPTPPDTATFCYFHPFAPNHPVLLQVASWAVSSLAFPSPKCTHNRISIPQALRPRISLQITIYIKKKKKSNYQKTISVSSFTSKRAAIILTHQASSDKIYHPVNGSLLKAGLFRAQCLLFWNERGDASGAIGAGCGSVAGGRMLGACVCQAKTDGELTLWIALGAEM